MELHLADAETALAAVLAAHPDSPACWTAHHGTLHVFLGSAAEYGLFTAALSAAVYARDYELGGQSGDAAAAVMAVAGAARNTWDARLADKGYMDGGPLGVYYADLTLIEDHAGTRP